MKTYKCTIIRVDRHGHAGTIHHLLAEVEIEANNKKDAKEQALLSMIGKTASEIGELDYYGKRPIGFPIDFYHAPEATRDTTYGGNGMSMTWEGTQIHKINEHDIRMKCIMVKAEKIGEE